MSPLIPPWCGTGVRHQEAEGLLASRFRAASTTYPEWWWRVRDLNPGPTDYDSAALTTELTRRKALYFPGSRHPGQEKTPLLQDHRLLGRAGAVRRPRRLRALHAAQRTVPVGIED